MTQIKPDDFAVIAAAELQKTGVQKESIYLDHQQFKILVKDDHGNSKCTVNLDNFFQRYQNAVDKDEQVRVLQDLVMVATPYELPATFKETAEHLFVQVKAKWFVDDLPHIALGEHLAAILVYDSPANLVYITDQILNDWNVSFEDAYSQAATQLGELAEFAFDTISNKETDEVLCHIFQSPSDSLSAARMIFMGGIESLPVQGDTLVMAPHRDQLIVTGSESQEGLAIALDLALKAKEESYALPAILHQLIDREYVPYRLPPDHPLYREFLLLELDLLERLYVSQKTILNSQFEQVMANRTILNYKFLAETERPFSACSVAPDFIPCLVPRSDFVTFGSKDELWAVATWDTVATVLGDKLVLVESYPPLYALDKFPEPEELEEMGFAPLPD